MTIIGPEGFACMNCGSLRPWNAQSMSYEPCSCLSESTPNTRVFTVMALNPLPTAANMTLRDWFAGQALMGMMASRSPTSPRFHSDDDAQYVYAVADAMLKAREEKP